MNISICITVLNEEASIAGLLDSLLCQTKKPDEIIIVDGGSTDKTLEIIKHFQKKDKRIKLLKEKCSRAKGRNLGIELAKGEIIAITDVGCIARNDWLEKITRSFKVGAEVVAGFYTMKAENSFEKAESVFLGVKPSDFGPDFLPATRSMAFKKEVWEKVGGFPENLPDAAEDTAFNYKILKSGIHISRVKEAKVEWRMPSTLSEFLIKIYQYAKGDCQTKILFFPSKGLASHNIHALLIILRYLVGVLLLFAAITNPRLWFVLCPVLLFYLFLAWRKGGFWGIVLQFSSDFAVMAGFISGLVFK